MKRPKKFRADAAPLPHVVGVFDNRTPCEVETSVGLKKANGRLPLSSVEKRHSEGDIGVRRRREPTDKPVHPTAALLVTTAVSLIDEMPVDQITVEDVLTRSGVSRGSLYHHFEDFQDLLEHAMVAIFARTTHEGISIFNAILEQSSTAAEFRERFLAAAHMLQAPDRMPHRALRIQTFALAQGNERFRSILAAEQLELTDGYVDFFTGAQKVGWARMDFDPRAFAVFVQACTIGMVIDDVTEEPVDTGAWRSLIESVFDRIVYSPEG